MDGKLRLEEHVASKLGKCFETLKPLYRICPYINVATKSLVCNSLVLSHLNYCDTVPWSLLIKKNHNGIQEFRMPEDIVTLCLGGTILNLILKNQKLCATLKYYSFLHS